MPNTMQGSDILVVLSHGEVATNIRTIFTDMITDRMLGGKGGGGGGGGNFLVV